MAQWVRNCQLPLTLVDIGGIADAKNESICAHASHAIILFGDPDHLSEWYQFCHKLKLRIIAEVFSDYNGTTDNSLVLGDDGIYRGSVHYLERGDLSVQQRPTVIELAKILVQMATVEEK